MPNTPTPETSPTPALDLDAHCHDCGLELAREGGCPDHPDAPKPRTDDGGEVLDPSIIERQKASAAKRAAGLVRVRIPHLGKLGWAKRLYHQGEVYALSVQLDGENRAAEIWHPSQVEVA